MSTAVAISLSLFAKKKPHLEDQENEREATNSEKGPKDDEEIVNSLKRAKLAEMKEEFEKAEELYHHALGLVNINQQHQIFSADRAMQARLYIFDGMANLALRRGQLIAAEKLYKQVNNRLNSALCYINNLFEFHFATCSLTHCMQ